MDASALVVPLWPAICAAAATFVTLVGVIVWVLTTFERRQDAIARNTAIETRVASLENKISNIDGNVSYIRGFLEKTGGKPYHE